VSEKIQRPRIRIVKIFQNQYEWLIVAHTSKEPCHRFEELVG
jgi:hypothetical protein